MSISFYKIIHLTGVIMVMLAYGGLIVRSALQADSPQVKRLGAITSGIGLLLILFGGFGLLAKLQYGFPLWIIAKIVIWFVLGGMIALINRKPGMSQILWWSTIVLGVIAIVMGLVKPF
jgi:hypothetical protein